MNYSEFRKNAHSLVDWMADYLEKKEIHSVSPKVSPGEIAQKLPDHAPENPENFEDIFKDFEKVILPGMTHWQHPKFFGYFPANNSAPSILAEMLMATLGAQCMSWLTSPAATELETKVTEWLRKSMGLLPEWTGVIQDTASTATLCALLTAREKYTQFSVNDRGIFPSSPLRVYCSTEAHSSVDKAVKVSGLGISNLVKIPVNADFSMNTHALKQAIQEDIEQGYIPMAVVSALGTTGSCALDSIEDIGKICAEFSVWHHIDAAYAGTALLLPECSDLIRGQEMADSFVFNPHKWMFTNFDCSIMFVKDPSALINTFAISPEYLKTSHDEEVRNYRDWGIQLGRRFRALKLWFVIRTYGVSGIRAKLRNHLQLAKKVKNWMERHENIEIIAPNELNVICFRYVDKYMKLEQLNILNAAWMKAVNDTGEAFFTHTKLNETYVIRWVIAQTDVEERHLQEAWQLLMDKLNELKDRDSSAR